jgi:hypothetical protein
MGDKDLYGIFIIAILFALAFIWLILSYVIGIIDRYHKNKSNYYNLKNSNILPSTSLIPLNNKLQDIVKDSSDNKYGDFYISDYIIFSSYNSAAGGTYKNDWVDEDILVNMINTGARFLDFEIYSMDNKAVIAVNDDFTCKETGTFNNLTLDSVLNKISQVAFQGSNNDPLFLQFRLKTKNQNVLAQLGKTLSKYLDFRLLPQFTSGAGKRSNINDIRLKELINKVVIICHDGYCDQGNILEKDPFYSKYVNISNRDTDTVSYYSELDVVNEADKAELIKNSRRKLCIVLPNQMKKGMNMNFSENDFHELYGMQIILQNLSYSKENHVQRIKKYMKDFYDSEHNCAFKIKKREHRREIIKFDSYDSTDATPGTTSTKPKASEQKTLDKLNVLQNLDNPQ